MRGHWLKAKGEKIEQIKELKKQTMRPICLSINFQNSLNNLNFLLYATRGVTV